MISTVLGESAVSRKTYKKRYRRFCERNFDLNDQPRSGQPEKFEAEELQLLLDQDFMQT